MNDNSNCILRNTIINNIEISKDTVSWIHNLM